MGRVIYYFGKTFYGTNDLSTDFSEQIFLEVRFIISDVLEKRTLGLKEGFLRNELEIQDSLASLGAEFGSA
ncbi:hypothetical protein [Anaerostipes faecalis]|uniref:hypothetical protein n=1 Tax=Anaerostipes faecalis TaxID=2738446 RepID=UPI001C1E4F5D|nr:hypothetical protein [Anaerostipes faecalis]